MVVKFNNSKDGNEQPKNSTKVNVLVALILVLFIALVSVSLLLGLEVRFFGQTESEFLFQYLHFQRLHVHVQNYSLACLIGRPNSHWLFRCSNVPRHIPPKEVVK